jgi:hypothetical protein
MMGSARRIDTELTLSLQYAVFLIEGPDFVGGLRKNPLLIYKVYI